MVVTIVIKLKGKSPAAENKYGGFISLKPLLLPVQVTNWCSQQIYLLITYVLNNSRYLIIFTSSD